MTSSPRIKSAREHGLDVADSAALPACPDCGTAMAVRPLRYGDDVDGLMWRCRRELVCTGTRRIRDPLVIQPTADSSTHAIFEWERSRDRRGWSGPSTAAEQTSGRGLFGKLGRAINRPTNNNASPSQPAAVRPTNSDSPLAGLIDYGYVVLDDRLLAGARAVVDHVVVGPTGIFVVDRKPWVGQISAGAEQVYVEGRQRTGATDDVTRVAAGLEDVLGYELKPIGTHVQSVITFDGASNRLFEATLGKIALTGTRSLAKTVRAGRASLGPETVVRLALAADRLLG
ncbi:MAG: nuclease-related domain-containing protein [Candidatus Limnocylindrales bacterium]